MGTVDLVLIPSSWHRPMRRECGCILRVGMKVTPLWAPGDMELSGMSCPERKAAFSALHTCANACPTGTSSPRTKTPKSSPASQRVLAQRSYRACTVEKEGEGVGGCQTTMWENKGGNQGEGWSEVRRIRVRGEACVGLFIDTRDKMCRLNGMGLGVSEGVKGCIGLRGGICEC